MRRCIDTIAMNKYDTVYNCVNNLINYITSSGNILPSMFENQKKTAIIVWFVL